MKDASERFARAEDVAEQLERSIETKKQVPVAVRAFVTKAKESRSGITTYFGFYLAIVFLPFLFGFLGIAFGTLAWIIVLGGATSIPGLSAISRARKLLSVGFNRGDLIRALEDDYRQRVEELPFIYGEDNETSARTLESAGNLALGVGLALGTFGVITGAVQPGGLVAVPLGIISAIVGFALRGSSSRRKAGRERRRIKRWKGILGKWIFKLAGLGLKKQSDASRLTYRPTEMAVGMAVLGLYEALPRATRETLGDLPSVVSGLEQDAQRMRQRVAELDEITSDTWEDADPSVTNEDSLVAQRARAVATVRAARDQAAMRLADAVAALETLRVDLLRIRAGEVSLDSVTQNLGAARDVAEQVDLLLSGQDEVSKLV